MSNTAQNRIDADLQKLLSCVPSNEENFNSLLRLMYRNVVVPFLGAGFSANFGYPGWRTFLEDLASKNNIKGVSACFSGDEMQYEKAASLVRKSFGSGFTYFLSQKFGDHVYKQKTEGTEDLELLPVIFPSLILTTNFDEVIEMLYSKVNMEYIMKLTPSTAQDRSVIIRRIANGQPTLIKLHGDVAKEEFVLAEKEYSRAYGCDEIDFSRPMPSLLRDILLSKIVLFMGCSLENDRTMELIDSVRSEGCMSFALLPLPEDTKNTDDPWKPNIKENKTFAERSEFLHQRNIIPIWYPRDQKQSLKIFLKELGRLMEPVSNHSVTVAHKRVRQLLEEGRKWNAEGELQQAYACYSQVESLVKTNPIAFDIDARIRCLEEVRRFYGSSDNGYKRRDIIKDMLALVKEEYTENSIEYAYWLHGLAYTFERYRYFDLMREFFKKALSIVDAVEAEKKQESVTILLNNGLRQEFSLTDLKVHLYVSMGYVCILDDDTKSAVEWYTKAETYLDSTLEKTTRAYLINGLSRYYELVDKDKEDKHIRAINCLNEALELRKQIVTMNIDADAAQHLLNTHSNLIRVYTLKGNLVKALEHFDQAFNENDAWKRLPYPKDAEKRLMEDKGDILVRQAENEVEPDRESKYNEALEAYRFSLKVRESLHWGDDIVAANLYEKIADILKRDASMRQEAIEYLIQAYVITEREKKLKSAKVQAIKQKIMELVQDDAAVEYRFKAQRSIMANRYGDVVDNREQELMDYFGDILEIA